VLEAAKDPDAMSYRHKLVTSGADNGGFRHQPHGNAKSMKGPIRWIAVAAALIPGLVLAASWWNGDWKYRKEISFDLSPAGADVAGTPQDVPILVRLSLGNFSYFNDTKPDGSDFRVLAGDDKTPLKFHFEKYDPQNQMALLWINVPQITGGSKTEKIYAYYGNPDAQSAADVPGTYDASQVLVLSFVDGAGTPTDLTAYKNNPSSSTAVLTPASLIGAGAKFSGKETITVPASPSLRLLPNQGLTASAWVRIEQAQQAVVFALKDGVKELSLGIDGTKFIARAAFNGAPITVTQTADFSLSQWHHVALTAGAEKLTLYVDGVAAGSAPVTLEELGGSFTIGSADASRFLSGDVDEVEVSKVVRSADWIKASARGQGMDANLVVYGADGQKEGSGQGTYFVTIAKNLTVDGWVVIGICLAMLVVALVIMLFKAIFLSRVEKANAKFLREFRRLSGDPTALDKEAGASEADDFEMDAPSLRGDQNKFGASTLYRLYHSGVFELNKRVAGKTVSAQRAMVLTPQSIDAIRASMDASMTRLQQSLSSQMVLLTIAISGGPFLGLLGTVIGVMITFAAIALSGDVNVNAIAPGTAAALAATVAGLAVAIPSLFGYNWLNSRIKNITADNRVFVDEFVTRVAEQYS
jgi:biopolymer transport protein ExbB